MSKPLLSIALLFGMAALPLISFAESAGPAHTLPAKTKGKTPPINKPTPLPPVTKAANPVPSLDFPLDPSGKGRIQVSKIRKADGFYLVAGSPGTSPLWTSANLGSEEKTFLLEDKATVLGMKDLTGDGRPELISSGFYGPSASGLYIYSWDDKRRTFTPIPNAASPTAEAFPHLVSDVPVTTGDDMVVEADGTIRLLGRVFDPKAENPPGTGIYSYRFAKDRFLLQKIELLPPPPDIK